MCSNKIFQDEKEKTIVHSKIAKRLIFTIQKGVKKLK